MYAENEHRVGRMRGRALATGKTGVIARQGGLELELAEQIILGFDFDVFRLWTLRFQYGPRPSPKPPLLSAKLVRGSPPLGSTVVALAPGSISGIKDRLMNGAGLGSLGPRLNF